MNDEPFGRQLKPVVVNITGGDSEDRDYWTDKICRYLYNQPCLIDPIKLTGTARAFRINPDANND